MDTGLSITTAEEITHLIENSGKEVSEEVRGWINTDESDNHGPDLTQNLANMPGPDFEPNNYGPSFTQYFAHFPGPDFDASDAGLANNRMTEWVDNDTLVGGITWPCSLVRSHATHSRRRSFFSSINLEQQKSCKFSLTGCDKGYGGLDSGTNHLKTSSHQVGIDSQVIEDRDEM